MYEGLFRDGLFHGRGTLFRPNGRRYVSGNWIFGKPHGSVQFYYTRQDTLQYEGELKVLAKGGYVFQGQGTLYDLEGKAVYQGGWENGTRQGNGTSWLTDGSIYSGNWEGDYPEGKGTYLFEDGTEYHGGFLQGKKNGRGIFKEADGFVSYDGEWKDGQRFGKGKVSKRDGSSYDGEWLQGKPNGQGNYTYPDGMVYSGYMDLGIRQGFGVLRREDGSIAYEGEWKNNVQEGKGKGLKEYPNLKNSRQ